MWSPSRPGIFYIAKVDGSIDVWDLLDKTHEPTLTQNVSPTAITVLYPHQVTRMSSFVISLALGFTLIFWDLTYLMCFIWFAIYWDLSGFEARQVLVVKSTEYHFTEHLVSWWWILSMLGLHFRPHLCCKDQSNLPDQPEISHFVDSFYCQIFLTFGTLVYDSFYLFKINCCCSHGTKKDKEAAHYC